MDYEQFKNDSEYMKLTDFINKWENNINYKKYETRILKEDLYEYLSDNQDNLDIINELLKLYNQCIND
tara:strand:- start:223 stop:426 length:204 start_codon:yes stop_codon:yes gene_type:complete